MKQSCSFNLLVITFLNALLRTSPASANQKALKVLSLFFHREICIFSLSQLGKSKLGVATGGQVKASSSKKSGINHGL